MKKKLNLNTYISDYCGVTFDEKPFCDEDNVALCYIHYMPLELGAPEGFDDEPILFSEMAQKVFAARGYQHKAVGLVLVKNISITLMQMAATRRFRDIRVIACKEVFENAPAVQFGACTFLLPNGEIVVSFRGTDDTLIGWEEDLNILTAGGVPSDDISIQYLAEVAKRYDGDITVIGHSKGGYVAQYAVINSPKEIRDRIKHIYNNDGPGLANYDYLDTDIYRELLPRYKHFIPQSSFIGMMLSHDADYTVVKSSAVTGAMQHELSTWLFKGERLWTLNDITAASKVTDLAFQDIRDSVSDDQKKALHTVAQTVIDGTKQRGLLDVKSNIKETLRGGRDAWRSIDDDTKDTFKSTLKTATGAIKKSVSTVRKGGYKSIEERLEKEN